MNEIVLSKGRLRLMGVNWSQMVFRRLDPLIQRTQGLGFLLKNSFFEMLTIVVVVLLVVGDLIFATTNCYLHLILYFYLIKTILLPKHIKLILKSSWLYSLIFPHL